MKKVLFVTDYASPYRVFFFDELSKYYDVTVVFDQKTSDQKHRNTSWFTSGEGKFNAVQLKPNLQFCDRFLCTDILTWLKKDFDYILIGGYGTPTKILAISWLRLHRKPFIMEVDGGLIRNDSFFMYRLKKYLIGGASRWFSTGRITTEYLTHYGADPTRIDKYPFTSLYKADILDRPVTKEEKKHLKQKLGLAEEKLILSVGQMIPRKGMDILLKASVKLPENTTICIVGGLPTEEISKLQIELKLHNIMYTGFLSKQQLAQYYKAADVLAIPTREDIWGLVVNEALAYGLPVVTTERCVAGTELIYNDINGYIIPTEDSDALAESLIKVLSADTEVMARNCLSIIKDYTIENMAAEHARLMEISANINVDCMETYDKYSVSSSCIILRNIMAISKKGYNFLLRKMRGSKYD